MRTYARIQSNVVAELFTTSQDVSKLFHQNLLWIDVTASPEVKVGWTCNGGQFEPPLQVPAPAPSSLVHLQAQLASLAEQISALGKAKS